MNHKLSVFGLVILVIVIFGFAFWQDLKYNQQQLANTPLVPLEDQINNPSARSQNDNEPALSDSDEVKDIEADLDATDFSNLDSDSAELEAGASGL